LIICAKLENLQVGEGVENILVLLLSRVARHTTPLTSTPLFRYKTVTHATPSQHLRHMKGKGLSIGDSVINGSRAPQTSNLNLKPKPPI